MTNAVTTAVNDFFTVWGLSSRILRTVLQTKVWKLVVFDKVKEVVEVFDKHAEADSF